MLDHRQQINNSCCGQTCVAMVADMWIGDVCEKTGLSIKAGTNGKHLIGALKKLKIKCSERSQIKREGCLPLYAILRVHSKINKKWRGHWIVVNDWKIYDPSLGTPLPCTIYWKAYPHFKVTSYIEILV